MDKKPNFKIIILALLLMIVLVVFLRACGKTSTNVISNTTNGVTDNITNGISDEAQEAINNLTFSSLSVFPVDLDTLFNPSNLNSAQDDIKNLGVMASQYRCPMTPYMQNFGTSHPEGTGKWYMYTQSRRLEVRAPCRAILTSVECGKRADYQYLTVTVNNEAVYENYRLTINLDKNKNIMFDHISALVNLVDKVTATADGYVVVEAGERIGYTSDSVGLDFQMEDKEVNNGISEGTSDKYNTYIGHRVCPLSYFTTDIQTKVTNYYNNVIYSAMRQGGKWPQSKIDSPVNFNIDGEVWGTWYYKSGNVGVDLSYASWFHFTKGILVFIAKSKTNSETFFNDLDSSINKSIDSVCPNLAGLYNQISNDPAYLVLEDGNNSEGIFSRRKFGTGEALDYVKFKVDTKTSSKYDDELSVKFFSSLSAANADSMTQDLITYIKDDEQASPQNY